MSVEGEKAGREAQSEARARLQGGGTRDCVSDITPPVSFCCHWNVTFIPKVTSWPTLATGIPAIASVFQVGNSKEERAQNQVHLLSPV